MEKLQVKVDKRIELLSICLRLSKYKKAFPHLLYEFKNYQYLNDVHQYFDRFCEHRCIQTLNKILDSGLNFSYDAPISLVLQINENGVFDGYDKYPFVNRLSKSNLILQFINEIKNFSIDSDFDEFFNKHKDFYNSEIKSFNETMDLSQVIPFMKKLKMDINGKEFIINLALLLSNGGYGLNENQRKVYCTMSKKMDCEGNALSSWGRKEKCYEQQSNYLHEFCHSIINPLTDKYFNQIKIPKVSKGDWLKLKENAYSSEKSYIEESFIRAIQICYIRNFAGDYQDFLNWNDSIGFRKEILLGLANNIEKSMNNDKSFEENFVCIANDSFKPSGIELKIE